MSAIDPVYVQVAVAVVIGLCEERVGRRRTKRRKMRSQDVEKEEQRRRIFYFFLELNAL
jgi:hypothetical protein